MKIIYTFSFRIFCLCLIFIIDLNSQIDTTLTKLNMDATYSRPLLTQEKIPIAIGGYVEANTQFSQTKGISDGFSFQARRMTLFFSSTIAKNIKFFSEIEFEDGTKEINLEFAAIDIEFNSLLNLRGGIIVNPIGSFNQNHDSPKWDFIDRPISSTTIIPSTLSNVGFGLFGKYFFNNWTIGYETYLTNGFDDKIILNNENKTSLSAGKISKSKFEESNSGLPMFTGKIAIKNREIGEIGISYLTGVYNKWKQEGIIIDEKRSASILALDFNSTLLQNKLYVNAEFAKVFVQIPSNYLEQFGREQFGGYLDLIYTLYNDKIFEWQNAKLNFGIRLEYVDYNQGNFISTGANIYDEKIAIVPSIAFRPVGSSVIRLNYRYENQIDLLGNSTIRTGVIQFGFATYF